jgi:MFS family permease
MTTARSAPTVGTSADHRGTLRAASFGTALALVAFTMPLGLMTAIGPDLGASVGGRTWILSSMSVGLAAALLVAGSLADDLGRRRIFLAGLATFAVGSFLGAAAPSVAMLSIARGLQGIGGAALLATSLSLLAHAFPTGPARAHATGIWGAMIGLGIAIGPIAAALVAAAGDWRTSYAVVGVVALAALAPSAAALDESRAPERRPIDLAGTALLALGLFALTAGIVQGNPSGWGSTLVVGCLAAGAALLAAFAVVELRTTAPLFDVRLLRALPFTAALAGSFVLGFTVLAFMSYAMTFSQTTLGATAVEATLWGAPWALVTFLVALKGRALARLMPNRVQVALGLAICGVGLLTMLGLHAGDTPLHMLPGFVVMGVGTGFLNAGLAQAAVGVVPPSRSGMGAGANNTARYLGAALGVALVVGTLHAGTERRAGDALGTILEPQLAVPLATEIADGGPRPAAAGFLPDARAVVGEIATASSAASMNAVIRTTAFITFVGAGLCFGLMRPRPTARSRDDDHGPAAGAFPTDPPPTDLAASRAQRISEQAAEPAGRKPLWP